MTGTKQPLKSHMGLFPLEITPPASGAPYVAKKDSV